MGFFDDEMEGWSIPKSQSWGRLDALIQALEPPKEPLPSAVRLRELCFMHLAVLSHIELVDMHAAGLDVVRNTLIVCIPPNLDHRPQGGGEQRGRGVDRGQLQR